MMPGPAFGYRLRRFRSLLLFVVALGVGGSGLGARTLEVAEGEGESQVRLEATQARRHSVHAEHFSRGQVAQSGEAEDVQQGSPCRARRDPSDPKSPTYQYVGPPRPSRAPPAPVHPATR
jgi:hypothetical protein